VHGDENLQAWRGLSQSILSGSSSGTLEYGLLTKAAFSSESTYRKITTTSTLRTMVKPKLN
jgi:hypothetical protein